MTNEVNKKRKKSICILALCWRDIRFSTMGGAEVYTHEMLKRAVAAGMKVIHFAPMENGLPSKEVIDGVVYLRKGTLKSVIFHARKFYKKYEDKIDFVIDQCNTFRFFTKFWVPQKKRIFFIHQLTREIWDISAKPPISILGKYSETPMLRLNRKDRAVIAVSDSTKQDLVAVGFDENKITVIPEGIPKDIQKLPLPDVAEKENAFIYVGRYARYKGIDDCIVAFGKIRKKYDNLHLWLVGRENEEYVKEQLVPICKRYQLTIGHDFQDDVVICGFLADEEKYNLQRKAKALLFPSLREGWGLIISEAGALGTPSITYDGPGMRDAVDHGRCGYLCKQGDVNELAQKMEAVLNNEVEYQHYRQLAWEYANQLDFDITGQRFVELILDLI